MPICWTPAPYLRPVSHRFAAARCSTRKHEASRRSPHGLRSSRAAMGSAFDRIRAGSNFPPDPALPVTHTWSNIPSRMVGFAAQNHRVETLGGGELLDG